MAIKHGLLVVGLQPQSPPKLTGLSDDPTQAEWVLALINSLPVRSDERTSFPQKPANFIASPMRRYSSS